LLLYKRCGNAYRVDVGCEAALGVLKYFAKYKGKIVNHIYTVAGAEVTLHIFLQTYGYLSAV